MKPVAPLLPLDEAQADEPCLKSEIVRMCDGLEGDHAGHEPATLPSPPGPETLQMATPFPPPDDPAAITERPLDTLPSPPPSASRKRGEPAESADEAMPPTIPGPPRVPRIAQG